MKNFRLSCSPFSHSLLEGRQIGVGFGGRRHFGIIHQGNQHGVLLDSASALVQFIVSEKNAPCQAGKDDHFMKKWK